MTFEAMGLKPSILRGLKEAGFEKPSPIQREVIPHILQGRDIIGQAHTGTGKTAAFALPALSVIDPKATAQILVITPTRELATQISDEIFRLGKFESTRTATIYGGQSYSRQLSQVREAQAVVATPGRLLDLLSSKQLGKFAPKFVILDEADEMLDMGFIDDIQEIFTYLPKERQTLLFSATMPKPIERLAEKILRDPLRISVDTDQATNKDIAQQFYVMKDAERDNALLRLIDSMNPTKGIVFCRTKKDVDRVTSHLVIKGYAAQGLHGDMEQPAREKAISRFRQHPQGLLIATDVAARGLDVADVTHVFNYHVPTEVESYVHRIGRTGRAGRAGLAITFISTSERFHAKRIMETVGTVEFVPLPTAKEVRKSRLEGLLQNITAQTDNEYARNLVATLQEQFPSEVIATKLMSLLLDQQLIGGPEYIGMSPSELKEFAEHNPRHSSRQGHNSRSHSNHNRHNYNERRAFTSKRSYSDSDKPRFHRGEDHKPGGRSSSRVKRQRTEKV